MFIEVTVWEIWGMEVLWLVLSQPCEFAVCYNCQQLSTLFVQGKKIGQEDIPGVSLNGHELLHIVHLKHCLKCYNRCCGYLLTLMPIPTRELPPCHEF